MSVLWVGLGAAIGAPLRYALSRLLDGDPARAQLPWGTIIANLSGSLLVGAVLATYEEGFGLWFAAVGLCGTLTTFSSFAVQVVDGGWRTGGLTVLITLPPAVALCSIAYWALS